MSHFYISIFCLFILTLIQVECAPQETSTKGVGYTSKVQQVTDELQTEPSSDTFANKILSQNKLQKSVEESMAEMLMEKEFRKRVDMEEEIVNYMGNARLEATAATNGDFDNCVNSVEAQEEALRNERDLREAIATEQQLVHMASSSSSELCNDDKCTQQCDPNVNKLKCHNESAVALCTVSGRQRIIRCSGLTPLCHPRLNVCTTRRLANQAISQDEDDSPDISCPSYNAYYPDLKSCRRFYYCANGKPYQYKCESNEVYNPMKRACVIQSATSPCRRFHCEGHHGRFAAYPGDPSVYAVCLNNRAVEMLHCPQGQAMYEASQECKTHCTGEGLIADYSSCTHYYECTNRVPGPANVYKITKRECPPDMVFNPMAGYCVPHEQYQICNQQLKQPATTSSTVSYTTLPTDSTTYTMEATTMQYIY